MQYGGVAANDEGEAAEALDAVGDPHGQLLLQVTGAFLQEERREGGSGAEWAGLEPQAPREKVKGGQGQ